MTEKLKIACVTGASRGIGAAVAMALASRGWTVIAVARTVGALEELDDKVQSIKPSISSPPIPPLVIVPADLCDFNLVNQLASHVFERFQRLDLLVNCVGGLGGGLSPLHHTDPKKWGKVMNLHLNLPYHLIRAFTPLLLAGKPSKAVFMTNDIEDPYWGAYAAAKGGLNAMLACWQKEVAKQGIAVHGFNPGPTQTRERVQAFPGEDESNLQTPDEVAQRFIQKFDL